MTEPKPPEDDLLPAFGQSVLAVVALLFVVANIPWVVELPREVEEAFVSHRMILEVRWFVPHSSEGWLHPPLHSWLSALLYLGFFGHGWELAWRLPGLIAALLIVFVLWRMGGRLFGNNIGSVLAAGAFGLNFLVPRLATSVSNEMLLAACGCGTGALILDKLLTFQPWTVRDHARLALLMSGSVLAGGLVGYASILPAMLATALSMRTWPLGARKWWAWLWLVPLAIYGVWLLWGGATGVRPSEGLGAWWSGHRLLEFLLRGLPWSAAMVAVLLSKPVREAIRHRPALTWLASWSVGSLCVAELRRGESVAVFLSALPPLCLLLAAGVRYLPRFRLCGQPLGRLAVLLPLVAAVLALVDVFSGLWRGFGLEHRQAISFGHDVRAVARRTERLLVVPGAGLHSLIDAGFVDFTPMDAALTRWRTGGADWLVIGNGEIERYQARLEPFITSSSAPADPSAPQGRSLLQRIALSSPTTALDGAGGSAAPGPAPGRLPPPELR